MTENLFYQILSSALHDDQKTKKVSFNLTWKNPVMEVKSYLWGILGNSCPACYAYGHFQQLF